MNNAGQTPKNIRIAQVGAQVRAQVGSVCSGSKETRHTESNQSTNTTPDNGANNQPTVNERLEEK